jgi:hypothetical protein
MNEERRMKAVPSTCAAILLVLAACSEAERSGQRAAAGPAAESDDRILCATGGAETLERVCTLEQQASEQGTVLVLRAPDGGFRRLRVTGGGQGVVAADGAEPAVVTPIGADMIEIAIGRDRYRLPATVQPGTS